MCSLLTDDFLQVVARDEESGEEVSTSVDIEVLQRGQPGKLTNTQTAVSNEWCG